MLLFKKKIFFYLYIFFLVLGFIFIEFSTNKALSKNFIISEIEIEEKYDLNFDKSKVIDKSFKKAFNVLIYKITEKKDHYKFENISIQEIKSLIDNFSIVDEKFINKNYKSKFEVQFNRKKTLNLFENKNIISSLPKEIRTFILPILINRNNNEISYLKQNIFFRNWNNISEKYFLIKYILPNEDIEDYMTIKKNINDIENYNFSEIINKYNIDNNIILIILHSDNQLRIFSKIQFDKKNMLINKFHKGIDLENDSSINKIILDIKEEYEDKWKSINKVNTSISLPIRLSIDTNNIRLSQKLEKILIEHDLVSDYKIEKFDNKKIIYKIIFNGSPDKLLDDMLLINFKIDMSNDIWKIK